MRFEVECGANGYLNKKSSQQPLNVFNNLSNVTPHIEVDAREKTILLNASLRVIEINIYFWGYLSLEVPPKIDIYFSTLSSLALIVRR